MVISWTITIETNTTGRFNFALSSEKHVENMALTNLTHCALQRNHDNMCDSLRIGDSGCWQVCPGRI